MDDNLTILMDEYKEMRNEIRTSYSLYFSILFGALFTGIIAAFVTANANKWMYILIPFLMCSWIGIITFIRCNIQHISTYIIEIEKKINLLTSEDNIYYETKHAPALWFSKLFIMLGAVTSLPFIASYIFSLVKGFQWLKTVDIFPYIEYLFFLVALIFGATIIYLFVEIPKRTRFKK